MKIEESTFKEIGQLVTDALLTHQGPINLAFKKNGEDDLKIGLKALIKPGPGDGDFKIKVDIDYIIEKATDSFTRSVSQRQATLNLDGPTKPCPLLPEGDEVYTNVCAKCKERQSIILVDGKSLPVWKSHRDPIEAPKEGYQMVQVMPCKSWADDDYQIFCADMLRKAIIHETEMKNRAEKEETKPEEKKKHRMKKAA